MRQKIRDIYDEDEEACRQMHKKAYRSFPISRVYQAHIPTCPSGYWLFGFASKKYHPLNDLDEKIDLVIDELLERMEIQGNKKVKNFPKKY